MTNENEILFSTYRRFETIHDTPRFVQCNNGHINATYMVSFGEDAEPRYVFQKINTGIFKKPEEVMENIVRVTGHIRAKLAASGKDADRGTMRVIPAKDGKPYVYDAQGGCWRLYDYVRGTVCYNAVESAEMFTKVGYAFGEFQRELADFDASLLHESIPNFHNTVSRYADFETALTENRSGRADRATDAIAFARSHREVTSFIMDRIASGELPLRVTHNDTKLNNILVDKETGNGLCVIDLDTVMPGSVLADFGDSIRFGASSAAEDEKDLDKVFMRLPMFDAYAKGFVSGLCGSLTEAEVRDLPMGALMLTLETGLRFLTDYLNGDTYFHTDYPEHNLVRARNQFKLVSDMEQKMPQMQAMIEKYI